MFEETPAEAPPAPAAAPPPPEEKGLTINMERLPGHNWGLTITGGADQVEIILLNIP